MKRFCFIVLLLSLSLCTIGESLGSLITLHKNPLPADCTDNVKAVTNKKYHNEIMQIEKEVQGLIQHGLPELCGYSIEINVFKDPVDLFRANFKSYLQVFKTPHKRIYRIQVNTQWLGDLPPQIALRAVLVHELTHILSYTQMTTAELIELGRKYDKADFQRNYERNTDLLTLRRGHALGLLEFRKWQKSHLSDDEFIKKMDIYYSIEMILAWMKDNPYI